MRYRCLACSRELLISSSAAWPERCPYCHAAPLHAGFGSVSMPLATPPPHGAGGGVAGGAEAIAGELLERSSETGSEAA